MLFSFPVHLAKEAPESALLHSHFTSFSAQTSLGNYLPGLYTCCLSPHRNVGFVICLAHRWIPGTWDLDAQSVLIQACPRTKLVFVLNHQSLYLPCPQGVVPPCSSAAAAMGSEFWLTSFSFLGVWPKIQVMAYAREVTEWPLGAGLAS